MVSTAFWVALCRLAILGNFKNLFCKNKERVTNCEGLSFIVCFQLTVSMWTICGISTPIMEKLGCSFPMVMETHKLLNLQRTIQT